MKMKVKMSMMMMKKLSDDDSYFVIKVILWWNLSKHEIYLVMKVMIVKEAMKDKVSPVAIFLCIVSSHPSLMKSWKALQVNGTLWFKAARVSSYSGKHLFISRLMMQRAVSRSPLSAAQIRAVRLWMLSQLTAVLSSPKFPEQVNLWYLYQLSNF